MSYVAAIDVYFPFAPEDAMVAFACYPVHTTQPEIVVSPTEPA